jgi:hypothetical protein
MALEEKLAASNGLPDSSSPSSIRQEFFARWLLGGVGDLGTICIARAELKSLHLQSSDLAEVCRDQRQAMSAERQGRIRVSNRKSASINP